MVDKDSIEQAPPADPSGAEVAPTPPVSPTKRANRVREWIAVVVSLSGGLILLIATQDIVVRDIGELGPRFWPTLLAWGLICLSVLLVTTNVLPARETKDLPNPVTGWGLSRLAITLVVLICYLAMFNVLQLWLITFVTIVLLLLLFGFRDWKLLLVFPGIIAAVLHVLFVILLRVPLG